MTEDFGSASPETAVGTQIAGYQIEAEIGRGGMAIVYRALDVKLSRLVALKILAPRLAEDESFRRRFMHESQAAAAVDHPHIIPVFEAGEAAGALFIAMRYVGTGDVRTLLERHGRLPVSRAVIITTQAASALDAAHARGLVHRDVKPANMLLAQAGDGRADHVYLSDFGLSKQSLAPTGLTSTGQFLGTLDYVAPEQIEGRAVDGRADLYALACATMEMLTGAPPFRREENLALMWAQLSEPPPLLSERRPDLPPALDQVIGRALAKAPDERYRSCLDFAAALRAAAEPGGSASLAASERAGGPAPSAGAAAAGGGGGGIAPGAGTRAGGAAAGSGRPAAGGGGLLWPQPEVAPARAAGRHGADPVPTSLVPVQPAGPEAPGVPAPSPWSAAAGPLASSATPSGSPPAAPAAPPPVPRQPDWSRQAAPPAPPAAPDSDLWGPDGSLWRPVAPSGGRQRDGSAGSAGSGGWEGSAGSGGWEGSAGSAASGGWGGSGGSGGSAGQGGPREPGGWLGPSAGTTRPTQARGPMRRASPRRRRRPGRAIAAVAIVALCLAAAGYVLSHRHHAGAGQPAAHGSSPARSAAGQGLPLPARAVFAYFAALNHHQYGRAWLIGGRNIAHQSFANFRSGYATTAHNQVQILSVRGNVVTVKLTATQTDGSVQVFEGSYTIAGRELTSATIHQAS